MERSRYRLTSDDALSDLGAKENITRQFSCSKLIPGENWPKTRFSGKGTEKHQRSLKGFIRLEKVFVTPNSVRAIKCASQLCRTTKSRRVLGWEKVLQVECAYAHAYAICAYAHPVCS